MGSNLLWAKTLAHENKVCIQYGAYISQVFNFANFESFVKFISAKILTATVRYMSSARVRETISTKFQETAIREKLDPRNISAIR